MENRTALKEKRNSILVIVWFVISFTIFLISVFKYSKDDSLAIVMCSQFCFLLYRVLTYGFNSLLLLFFRAKKFKINRLKDKVSPIYKIEDWGCEFYIKKYSVYCTKLDLQWSMPFSVLFEEQEYLYDGSYIFKSVPEDIAVAWEAEESKKRAKESLKIAEKDKKQQKLDKLNKVFNDNYK